MIAADAVGDSGRAGRPPRREENHQLCAARAAPTGATGRRARCKARPSGVRLLLPPTAPHSANQFELETPTTIRLRRWAAGEPGDGSVACADGRESLRGIALAFQLWDNDLSTQLLGSDRPRRRPKSGAARTWGRTLAAGLATVEATSVTRRGPAMTTAGDQSRLQHRWCREPRRPTRPSSAPDRCWWGDRGDHAVDRHEQCSITIFEARLRVGHGGADNPDR